MSLSTSYKTVVDFYRLYVPLYAVYRVLNWLKVIFRKEGNVLFNNAFHSTYFIYGVEHNIMIMDHLDNVNEIQLVLT